MEKVAQVTALDTAWTPEALRAEVERERALREVVIEYYRSNLKEGHHYYTLPGQRKPALSKEGALNICSLFKVMPDPEPPVEVYHPDGHYSARYRVHLRSALTGKIVGTGDAGCTTREAKYAYRWVRPSMLPAGADKDTLPARRRKQRNEWVTEYRVPNEDLADQYNTVLKMAYKRAIVAATHVLPLVSELFTQDLEESLGDADAPADAPAVAPETPPPPHEHASPTARSAITRRLVALKKRGITKEELVALAQELFDKSRYDDLTDDEAEVLVETLEARVGAHASA
jgi:hypothetical protein